MNILQRLGLFPPPVTVPYYGDWTTLIWENRGAASVEPHPSVFTNYPIWGIDISKWQGDIDLVKAKADGIRFVLAKCSEGYGYYDPKFERTYALCQELHLPLTAYHFVRPGVATQYQLDTIKKALEGKPVYGFALDCEVWDGQDSAKITDVIWNLLIKCKPFVNAERYFIYSRKSWWDYYVKRSTHWKEEADAWPAHWGVEKPWVMADWPSWTVWQAGIVNNRFGVPGAIDFDVWNPAVPFPGDEPPPADDFSLRLYVRELDKLIEVNDAN
jgi:lysozyme